MQRTVFIVVTLVLFVVGLAGCKCAAEEPEDAMPDPSAAVPPPPPPPPDEVKAPPKPPPPAEGLRQVLLDGRKAYNAGDFDRAMALFQQAVEKAPGVAEPLVDLGRAMARKGELEQAKETLVRAAAVNPDDAFALLNLGHVLSLTGEDGKGLEHLRRAAELKPNHPAVLCGLVLALAKARETEELGNAREKANAAGGACPDGKDPLATYGDVK